MKGIILAGGSGKRLNPATKSISKQIIPVYDKPMIYYPLSVLLLAGIKEVLIISTPRDIYLFQSLLTDGSSLGITIKYEVQAAPNGPAEAFIIGEDFIGDDSVCLILGDNIFYGHGLTEKIQRAANLKKGALIFGYNVSDPKRYGVAELDENRSIISITEKPTEPKSNCAVTGLYFYDNKVIQIAKNIKPSLNGEKMITDINNQYLKNKDLKIELLGRGIAWFDAGTHQSLLESSIFIKTIEDRQGVKIACLEEIAFNLGYIDDQDLLREAKLMGSCDYSQYLLSLIEDKK